MISFCSSLSKIAITDFAQDPQPVVALVFSTNFSKVSQPEWTASTSSDSLTSLQRQTLLGRIYEMMYFSLF